MDDDDDDDDDGWWVPPILKGHHRHHQQTCWWVDCWDPWSLFRPNHPENSRTTWPLSLAFLGRCVVIRSSWNQKALYFTDGYSESNELTNCVFFLVFRNTNPDPIPWCQHFHHPQNKQEEHTNKNGGASCSHFASPCEWQEFPEFYLVHIQLYIIAIPLPRVVYFPYNSPKKTQTTRFFSLT